MFQLSKHSNSHSTSYLFFPLQEEGMVTFGRVLVYGCIIRSNIFQQLNEEQKSFILDQLLLFCYKRSYVSAPTYYYIEQFLKLVSIV